MCLGDLPILRARRTEYIPSLLAYRRGGSPDAVLSSTRARPTSTPSSTTHACPLPHRRRLNRLLTGADDTIASRIDDNVYSAPALDTLLHDRVDSFANAHVAEQPETPLVPALHLRQCVLMSPTDCCHTIAMSESFLHKRAANMTRCAEYDPYFGCRRIGLGRRICVLRQ